MMTNPKLKSKYMIWFKLPYLYFEGFCQMFLCILYDKNILFVHLLLMNILYYIKYRIHCHAKYIDNLHLISRPSNCSL